jgi:hypothetical protein
MCAAPEDEDIQASSLLFSFFLSHLFTPRCTLEHSTMFVRHFPGGTLGVQMDGSDVQLLTITL